MQVKFSRAQLSAFEANSILEGIIVKAAKAGKSPDLTLVFLTPQAIGFRVQAVKISLFFLSTLVFGAALVQVDRALSATLSAFDSGTFLPSNPTDDISPGDQALSEEYYQLGVREYVKGNYDQAILHLSGSLMTYPRNWKARELLRIVGGEKYQALSGDPEPPDPRIPWENVLYGLGGDSTSILELKKIKEMVRKQGKDFDKKIVRSSTRLTSLIDLQGREIQAGFQTLEKFRREQSLSNKNQSGLLNTMETRTDKFRFRLVSTLSVIILCLALCITYLFFRLKKAEKAVVPRPLVQQQPQLQVQLGNQDSGTMSNEYDRH